MCLATDFGSAITSALIFAAFCLSDEPLETSISLRFALLGD